MVWLLSFLPVPAGKNQNKYYETVKSNIVASLSISAKSKVKDHIQAPYTSIHKELHKVYLCTHTTKRCESEQLRGLLTATSSRSSI